MMAIASEILLLALLAGLGIAGGALDVGMWLTSLLLLGGTLLDRRALLFVLLLDVGSLSAASLPTAGGLVVVASCIGLGVLGFLRKCGSWSPLRRELSLATLVTVVFLALSTTLARAALALRSEVPLLAGRIDFIASLILVPCLWAGLDGTLPYPSAHPQGKTASWLWGHRHAGLLLLVAGVRILLAGAA